MLIDTRRPPPPEGDPLYIDWTLVGWITACLALLIGARYLPAPFGIAPALAGLWCLLKVLDVGTGGYRRGISDWRQ